MRGTDEGCVAENFGQADLQNVCRERHACVAQNISLVAWGSFWAPNMSCLAESLAQDA